MINNKPTIFRPKTILLNARQIEVASFGTIGFDEYKKRCLADSAEQHRKRAVK